MRCGMEWGAGILGQGLFFLRHKSLSTAVGSNIPQSVLRIQLAPLSTPTVPAPAMALAKLSGGIISFS